MPEPEVPFPSHDRLVVEYEKSLKPALSSNKSIEERVRDAAVRVITANGTSGSGTLISYKGLTMVLTANHVAGGSLGEIFYVINDDFQTPALLVYSEPKYDISILYLVETPNNIKPMKYSPRKQEIKIGEEIFYSGYPSVHELMSFPVTIEAHSQTNRECVK